MSDAMDEAGIAALKRRARDAALDTARLDWLSAVTLTKRITLWFASGDMEHCIEVADDTRSVACFEPSGLRAVIDAAMARERETGR